MLTATMVCIVGGVNRSKKGKLVRKEKKTGWPGIYLFIYCLKTRTFTKLNTQYIFNILTCPMSRNCLSEFIYMYLQKFSLFKEVKEHTRLDKVVVKKKSPQ